MEAELNNPNLKFQPSINKGASTVKHQDESSVVERLCRDANDRLEKNYKNSELALERASEEYKFVPTTLSEYRPQTSSTAGLLEKDFFARQQLLGEQRQEHQGRALDHDGCTFHPEINNVSEAMMAADPKRGNETEEECVRRLARRDKKKEECLREVVDAENRSKYTYHPEINERSKRLTKNLCKSQTISPPEPTKPTLDLEVEKCCTFHPQINPQSKAAESHYASGADIMRIIHDEQQERELKRTQCKKDAEYEEARSCTFKPVMQAPGRVAQFAVVAGLGRHLELQERKKRLEDERKQREDDVFGFSKKYDERTAAAGKSHYTVPQPFPITEVRNSPARIR